MPWPSSPCSGTSPGGSVMRVKASKVQEVVAALLAIRRHGPGGATGTGDHLDLKTLQDTSRSQRTP